MPRQPSRFTQADVARAIKAWQAAGLAVGALEIRDDGSIRIEAPREPAQDSALDKWLSGSGSGNARRDTNQRR